MFFSDAHSTTIKERQPYWVFIGNSRVRNLYYAICSILNGTDCGRVDYTYCHKHGGTNCEKGWTDEKRYHYEFMEFIPDKLLFSLPDYLDRWLNNPDQMPTRLHIGKNTHDTEGSNPYEI